MANKSKIHSHANGRLVKRRGVSNVTADSRVAFADLQAAGIFMQAMDSALIGGGSGGVPGYVSRNALETWLPGTLRTITQVRNADRILGVTVVGDPFDEEIKLTVEEIAGQPVPYADNTPIPFADIRTTTEARKPITFELGFSVGLRESKRLDAQGIEAATSKRRAVTEALDMSRNRVAFNGYNGSGSNTYGLLNEPNLAGYEVHSSNGFSAVGWDGSVTFDSLTTDFSAMFKQIVSQSGGHVQEDAQMVFVIPTIYLNHLNVMHSNTGLTFRAWLNQNYANLRIENTPEFNDAQTKGVAYLIVENAGQYDDSDTDGATIIQVVPERFRVLGSETQIKGYVEDCVNTTAGVWVLRPWAVCRLDLS